MIKDSLLSDIRFFSKNNQRLVIWKSFDRIEESLEGKTDFDFLLLEGDMEKLHDLMTSMGWVRFRSEHWRYFDKIYDYFKPLKSENGKTKIIHFHIHENIRTGERFTKSLHIPNSYFTDSLIRVNLFETINSEQNFKLSIIRTAYKTKLIDYLLSLIRLDKESIFKYRNELFLSNQQYIPHLQNTDYVNFLHTNSIYKFTSLLFQIRKKNNYLKQPNLFKLYYLKLIFSKISPGGKKSENGLLVSFVGIDGVGKSTLTNILQQSLSKQFKFKLVYMGIPKSIKKIRFLLGSVLKTYTTGNNKPPESLEINTLGIKRFINTIFSLFISLIKIAKIFYIYLYKKNGYIVVTDRYPIIGISDDLPQWKDSLLSRIELKLNKLFKAPDLIFILHANKDILQSRRDDYKNLDYLEKLNVQSKLLNFSKKNNNIIEIDTSLELNESEFLIISKIFEILK
jgi:thymidylate kinase